MRAPAQLQLDLELSSPMNPDLLDRLGVVHCSTQCAHAHLLAS